MAAIAISDDQVWIFARWVMRDLMEATANGLTDPADLYALKVALANDGLHLDRKLSEQGQRLALALLDAVVRKQAALGDEPPDQWFTERLGEIETALRTYTDQQIDRTASPQAESVRFPAMREEVRFAIAALSNEAYQLSTWRAGSIELPGNEYDFDAACHTLLDDVNLIDDPASWIGLVLLDEAELDVATQLANVLLKVVKGIGKMGTFEDALGSGKWPAVLAAAQSAALVIGRPAEFP